MKRKICYLLIKKAASYLLFAAFALLTNYAFSQGAAVNATGASADPSAMLDISSNNSGILIPRLTETQKNSIASPATGLMIYQTDGITGFWYYNGSLWLQSIGATGANGVTGPTGADGATGTSGFLSSGSSAGNTPYWDGTQWVVNSSNIFNNGGSVGINTSAPDNSAYLDISGTDKGLLIPRMTTSERNLIASPAEGLEIYNLTTLCFEFYTNGNWQNKSCSFTCGVDNLIDRRDGNIYKTVKIGSQCWMKENLKYLPSVVGPATGSETIKYYYVYGYDGSEIGIAKWSNYYSTYGVLYNWPAAMDGNVSNDNNPSGIKGVCPSGWHLPSDNEWKQLEITLGMSQALADLPGWRGSPLGGQLKAPGTTYWTSPNTAAGDFTGFSALPGGYRDKNTGTFVQIGNYASLWSCTEILTTNALIRHLFFNNSHVCREQNMSKEFGVYVRCLKD